ERRAAAIQQSAAQPACFDEQKLAVFALLDAAVHGDDAFPMEAADVWHRGVADHDALEPKPVQYGLHASGVQSSIEVAAVPDRAGLAVIQRSGGGIALDLFAGGAQRCLVGSVGACRIQ